MIFYLTDIKWPTVTRNHHSVSLLRAFANLLEHTEIIVVHREEQQAALPLFFIQQVS